MNGGASSPPPRSDDDLWYWDGEHWQSLVASDGASRWTGGAWVPMDRAPSPAPTFVPGRPAWLHESAEVSHEILAGHRAQGVTREPVTVLAPAGQGFSILGLSRSHSILAVAVGAVVLVLGYLAFVAVLHPVWSLGGMFSPDAPGTVYRSTPVPSSPNR